MFNFFLLIHHCYSLGEASDNTGPPKRPAYDGGAAARNVAFGPATHPGSNPAASTKRPSSAGSQPAAQYYGPAGPAAQYGPSSTPIHPPPIGGTDPTGRYAAAVATAAATTATAAAIHGHGIQPVPATAEPGHGQGYETARPNGATAAQHGIQSRDNVSRQRPPW